MAKSKDVITQIKKATRRKFSADEKIRIILEGLRGEASISEICRREGIASSVYYKWSKAFLEAGKSSTVKPLTLTQTAIKSPPKHAPPSGYANTGPSIH
ncbi:MAG: transposase [Planctomycetota bacterium]|jgi:transposase-like protein